jgi:Tol biopolymer transport system component
MENPETQSAIAAIARLSEAPFDAQVDYIGYYGISPDGLAHGSRRADFSLSPDSQRVVYARGYDIFEESLSYSAELPALVDAGWNLYPVYSPAEFSDDAEIAFLHSDDGTHYDLAILNSQRDSTRQVTHDYSLFLERPAWLPQLNSTQIAFSALNADMDYDIYVVDSSTNSVESLIATPANDHAPSWSPDGTRLAFVSDRVPRAGIYVFNHETGETEFLEEGNSPEWSPDGTTIAFERDDDLYVMDADGSNVRLFIENAYSPNWDRSY